VCRSLEGTLDLLEVKGVTIIDRRQTYLDKAVDVNRICRGAVLYPGTRLVGARTFVGPVSAATVSSVITL
jgi:hypothetical protein